MSYIGIGETARKLIGGYIGVDGVARKITKAYVGDENGIARLAWVVQSGGKVILEVEKITSDTYAGEAAYTGEQFILLDIYPKTNGTVNVTYGGLTKTITDTSGAAEPNAQQVFFGTFNGVSDSVVTPVSGALIIEGDCRGFGCGVYLPSAKNVDEIYTGLKAINSWGQVTEIPASAFGGMLLEDTLSISEIIIKNGIKKIGDGAFARNSALTSLTIPASVLEIGSNPVYGISSNSSLLNVDDNNTNYKMINNCLIEVATNRLVSGFADSVIPSYITMIGDFAFFGQSNLTSVTIPASVTHIGQNAFTVCNVTAITMLSTIPPSLGTPVIAYNDGLVITVPKGCGDIYKTAERWSDYADCIVEAS